MSSPFLDRGGLWVVMQLLLMLAVAIFGAFWRTDSESNHLWRFPGALLLLGLSALTGLAGVSAMGRRMTPFPKPPPETELVQRGIYRFIRHPLYTSVICAAFGWSLMRGSWPALVASIFLAVFFACKARREERWLRQRFPDHREYEARVRRFIPWIY